MDCLYKTHRFTYWTERLEKRTTGANRPITWFIKGRMTMEVMAYCLQVVVPTRVHTAWKSCWQRYWKSTPNDQQPRWRRRRQKIVYVRSRRDIRRQLISYYIINCVVFAKKECVEITLCRECRTCEETTSRSPHRPFPQCSITTDASLRVGQLIFLAWR